MAESMFNTDGSLSSTDPKVIQAAMRATGGQILPSSPSFRRALELAQLRDVQMKQGMAEGSQAVKSLKEYQAANPPTISGLPSNQVVTSDTGFKAVLDAQGNIVGTNAPVTAGKKIYDKVLGTSNDPTSGQNIRDAFLKEYAKPKPVQAVAVEEVLPVQAVTAPAQTPIGPAAAQPINQDYFGDALARKPNLNELMASAQPYVPYGTGESYIPVEESGKPLTAEVRTNQLVAATPTSAQRESMFEAVALRKKEMKARQELDVALQQGNTSVAKKLSDEILSLRKKYMTERERGGYGEASSAFSNFRSTPYGL